MLRSTWCFGLLFSMTNVMLFTLSHPFPLEQSEPGIRWLWENAQRGIFYNVIPDNELASAAWRTFLRGKGIAMIENRYNEHFPGDESRAEFHGKGKFLDLASSLTGDVYIFNPSEAFMKYKMATELIKAFAETRRAQLDRFILEAEIRRAVAARKEVERANRESERRRKLAMYKEWGSTLSLSSEGDQSREHISREHADRTRY